MADVTVSLCQGKSCRKIVLQVCGFALYTASHFPHCKLLLFTFLPLLPNTNTQYRRKLSSLALCLDHPLVKLSNKHLPSTYCCVFHYGEQFPTHGHKATWFSLSNASQNLSLYLNTYKAKAGQQQGCRPSETVLLGTVSLSYPSPFALIPPLGHCPASTPPAAGQDPGPSCSGRGSSPTHQVLNRTCSRAAAHFQAPAGTRNSAQQTPPRQGWPHTAASRAEGKCENTVLEAWLQNFLLPFWV